MASQQVGAHRAGKDRDVTADVKPFMAYKRNDLDLTIKFSTKLTPSRCELAQVKHFPNSICWALVGCSLCARAGGSEG